MNLHGKWPGVHCAPRSNATLRGARARKTLQRANHPSDVAIFSCEEVIESSFDKKIATSRGPGLPQDKLAGTLLASSL